MEKKFEPPPTEKILAKTSTHHMKQSRAGNLDLFPGEIKRRGFWRRIGENNRMGLFAVFQRTARSDGDKNGEVKKSNRLCQDPGFYSVLTNQGGSRKVRNPIENNHNKEKKRERS